MWRACAFAAFAVAACTGAAKAQTVETCEWQASAAGLVEPWESHTQTFSNGNVRLALLDLIEPAAGSFHILILSPPYDELGGRQCATLGVDGTIGFSGVDFGSLQATYDPAVGLVFDVNVEVFAGDDFERSHLRFTLNQDTGEINSWYRY